MTAPLYEKLNEYKNSGVYPFHMPGHKRQKTFGEPFEIDITEIEGFDNLHKPEGVILEAEKLAAKAFGAKESHFVVNGSSGGIIAAVLSCVRGGEEIIIGRNCHKSVFDAIVLSGAVAHYVMPETAAAFPVMGAVTAEAIARAAEEYPKSRAIVVTSPTYEGIVSDIRAIAETARKHGMTLIVDEAHGAHFKFCHGFPETAIEMGADIVVQSLHKTLPSPTQTAIVHTGENFENSWRLKKTLAMMQSSSPSYFFMAAIDKCRDFAENAVDKFESYASELGKLRESLSGLKNFEILDSGIVGQKGIKYLDPGKIVLFSKGCDMRAAADILRNKFKIEAEMATPLHIIAMTSVCDTNEGFKRLREAFFALDAMALPQTAATAVKFIFPRPYIGVSPSKAFDGHLENVKLADSLGRISGELAAAYPPGIPLVAPGEVITKEVLEQITLFKLCNINITGTNDNTLENILVLS